MPIIPKTQEAEVGRLGGRGLPKDVYGTCKYIYI